MNHEDDSLQIKKTELVGGVLEICEKKDYGAANSLIPSIDEMVF